jgi:hypothetical protein
MLLIDITKALCEYRAYVITVFPIVNTQKSGLLIATPIGDTNVGEGPRAGASQVDWWVS